MKLWVIFRTSSFSIFTIKQDFRPHRTVVCTGNSPIPNPQSFRKGGQSLETEEVTLAGSYSSQHGQC